MRLLSIDTSGAVCSAAVFEQDRLISEIYLHHRLNHSAVLMELIDECLERAECKLSQIDCFAVSVGPGSFTGLRIGIGTVKAFSQATSKGIAAVSSLDLLAQNAPEQRGVVCALMDARNRRVFAAIYENGKKILEDCVLELDELKEKLPQNQPIYFVGDGALAYLEDLKERFPGCSFAPSQFCLQRASAAYPLALAAMQQGKLLTSQQAKLNYLVQSQAERNFKEKGQ